MVSQVPADLPRLVIENVRPSVDGGRYPAKRAIGEAVRVVADVYRDGHDWIAARVRYRRPGQEAWCTAPMTYEPGWDRCSGEFTVDAVGRWSFAVEAWTDRFTTWRRDIEKKLRAGQDVTFDLIEGAEMVAEASLHAEDADSVALADAAVLLRSDERRAGDRSRIALDEQLAALVLQHLPPADLTSTDRVFDLTVDPVDAAFASWYEMFPRSQSPDPGRHGTFRDAAERLPALAELGFDVVYLPPIHPIGRTNRKGRNNALVTEPGDPGSPWAIGNSDGGHMAIEPALGTMRDFDRFVKRARKLGIEVALDYALQCAPDHPWVAEHPDWFFVRPDGTIKHAENPPRKYEDIVPINFWCDDHAALWNACLDVLLHWIRHGVRTFRVDNPHTKPFAFWAWLIAEVKAKHPETVFLSEAFTRPTRLKGLARLGFTQSYTYFTWRNSAAGLREYMTELTTGESVEFMRPNFFTNTPDILHEYLQTGGRPAFLVRLVLAGTLSPLYGIYSGYELCENVAVRPGSEEYLDSEKYEIRVRDWNGAGNINADIALINRIRREHPALQRLDNLRFGVSENDSILFYHKSARDDELLIAVNIDPHIAMETMVHVPLGALGIAPDEPFEVHDLLSDATYTWQGVRNYVRLDPDVQVAHVFHVRRLVSP
jgi:starch synthase (maltosyl-transferring)